MANSKMSIDELRDQLYMPAGYAQYTQRSDEDLRRAAENRYASVYNQKRLTAQKTYETSDLAYQQQLAELQSTLQDNQLAMQKETNDSIAAANRYLTTRGMQRSSYGLQNQAAIERTGAQNLLALQKQYAMNANGIQNNRSLLAQQLANTLAAYDTDYQTDVLAYIDEQKQIDMDRFMQLYDRQNELTMQLFEYSQKYGKSSGGSSKKSSGSTSPKPASEPTPSPISSTDFWASINENASSIYNDGRASSVKKKTSTTQDGSKYSF